MAIWQDPMPASKTPCCWTAGSKIIWNPCRSDGEWLCSCTMTAWRWSKPDSKTDSAEDSWNRSVNLSRWPSFTLLWPYQCSWRYFWPMLFSFDHAVSLSRIIAIPGGFKISATRTYALNLIWWFDSYVIHVNVHVQNILEHHLSVV